MHVLSHTGLVANGHCWRLWMQTPAVAPQLTITQHALHALNDGMHVFCRGQGGICFPSAEPRTGCSAALHSGIAAQPRPYSHTRAKYPATHTQPHQGEVSLLLPAATSFATCGARAAEVTGFLGSGTGSPTTGKPRLFKISSPQFITCQLDH